MRMRMRVAAALFTLILVRPGTADEEQVKWIKWEEARARSVATGKPVLVFCITDLLAEGPATKGLDRVFTTEPIRLQRDDFLFVKCSDMTTVRAVKATSKCELIVFDPDGDELLRTVVKSSAEVAAAMKETTARYSSKAIQWNVNAPPVQSGPSDGKQMVVVLFGNDSDEVGAAVRSLEDRRVAKLHSKCVFVRMEYRKDSPEVKAWNVISAPTLLVLDSVKDFGPKSVIERSSERKNPKEMKAFLARVLGVIEKSRR
ncbi:MAG TPA: hypothetical protein VE981_09930 [Planctomycetota bacterium]|nr:hypothetical protein [Planctomycetota bacterium]